MMNAGPMFHWLRGNVLSKKAVLPQCSLEFNRIESVSDACFRFGSIDVLETGYWISRLVWGKEQAAAGQIAMDSIRTSIELGLEGEIDAVTTAPINKVAIKMVGVKRRLVIRFEDLYGRHKSSVCSDHV